MELVINGEKQEVADNINSLDQLLDLLSIGKETVVVEHNLKIVKRDRLENSKLQSGDVVEIVRFVGGGLG